MQRIVDDDLGTGHQEDVLVLGKIEQRVAEIAIVAAGILEADDRAFPGKRRYCRARQLDVHADRDVIGDQRNVDGVPDIAEMVERSRTGW